jgi:hypothetical protein
MPNKPKKIIHNLNHGNTPRFPSGEINFMEVHTHTPRNKYLLAGQAGTHYFWEFLMLFLAVFCGFLAEYQLEHKIEKDRGKQYVQSFYEDLKYDTASISGTVAYYKEKIEKLQLIPLCYDSLSAKLSCNSCLTDLLVNTQFFAPLIVSDRTLQQLKNAGGMRLLNKADADSVIVYDNLVKEYKNGEATVFQEIQTTLRNIMSELFYYSATRKFINNSYVINEGLLVTTDRILINKYFNTLTRYNDYCIYYLTVQQDIRSKATGLINYFTKKYHFR